jgi:hypothetical protein
VLEQRRGLALSDQTDRQRCQERLACPECAKPERRGRPAGSRAHFLKLNASGVTNMHKAVHDVQPSGCVGPLLDSLPAALPPPGDKESRSGPLSTSSRSRVLRELGPGEPAAMGGAVMGPHRTAHRGLEVGLRAISCMIAWSVHRRSQFWSQLSPSIGIRERPHVVSHA